MLAYLDADMPKCQHGMDLGLEGIRAGLCLRIGHNDVASVVGGLYCRFFPEKLQTENIEVLAGFVPHCREKGQAA